MAQSIITELERLNGKLDEFAAARLELLKRVAELEEENTLLRNNIKEKDSEINRLDKDIKFLQISHKLAQSPDNIIEARKLVTRLIHTVDSCISMIKDI